MNYCLPTLYCRTALGQIQEWTIEVDDCAYRTHEGIMGGIITTSEWTYTAGKNVGRANETSDSEQAQREAKSKWQKKLDSGYHEDITQIDVAKFFEPMLAKKWGEVGIQYPLYCQPKLDGLRCIVNKDGMWSRNGKPIKSAPHIYEVLKPSFETNPQYVFDGEIYSHKLKSDFNKIISLAKKTKPSAKDLAESAKSLQYWTYDLWDGRESCFYERFSLLSGEVSLLNIGAKKKNLPECLVLVPTMKVDTEEELDKHYSDYLDEGFEGQMVRQDAVYENKRSKFLLKRKTWIDEEFEIVGIEEGKGNLTGIAARAILKTNGGIQFEAGMIGNHEYCAELYNRRSEVVGMLGTVVYQNLTPDGKPRFAKMKGIRDYE